MISADDFRHIISQLGDLGQSDIEWAESCAPPTDPEDFASEAIFVICNSGMKNTIARNIYRKVMEAIDAGMSASAAFGHPGKAAAIDDIWSRRREIFEGYMRAPDKLEFCASLLWIGEITKYHLAKNFGAQVAKPDVHLKRLADREGVSAQTLCERLSAQTGYKIATIDTLLWRACANGIINSKTGEIRSAGMKEGKDEC